MKIYEFQQYSPEWYAVRLGHVTASCFGKAIAGGQGKTRKAYMIDLVAERMTEESQNGYSNAVMQRGSEVEPQAREYYEQLNGCEVRQIGFVERDEDVGCSPDGLVGDDGMTQFKCPNSSTHIAIIIAGKMPMTHIPQVQGEMWVADRQWNDFVSYDPRVKRRPYFCQRIYRDDAYIQELHIKIVMFIDEMKAIIEKLMASPF